MDKELEVYYTERFSMMGTQGWKDLCDDLEKLLDNYRTVDKINNEQELFFRKGQVDILKWILNLKEVSEQAYKELQDA